MIVIGKCPFWFQTRSRDFATPAQVALGNYYYCLALFSWPSLFAGHHPRLPYECSVFSSIIPEIERA
jgi:hypothetical protein